ncbi:MAG: helix-turn-helix domain containing protein [Phaeodactylibacter sp.]|nr:helix-turn-helix domain containing protein [Phaeodactylibacter sp.]
MKKQHLQLQEEDRTYLKDLLSKGSLRVRVQKRAMCLQELDRGKTYQEASRLLNVSYPTVLRWAKHYREGGLSFLQDKPRSGRPVGLSAEQKAQITAIACSEPPEGYARWSLRLLADRIIELNLVEHISHTEVGRILKKMNCSLTEKGNGA